MLQRAASSACSWWWASHIRTKQSKWLEQSMMDMEEKVQGMLKLIEEDGDSFAKRAEMYYKRRPELISSVEDTYRAFKALADRYDLLSKELQNANRTIATVFPEQVQFDMEDDDCPTPKNKFPKKSKNASDFAANIPKVPKAPMESLKGLINTASKQFQPKKSSTKSKNRLKPVAKSGLSKDEALEQIDKIHKEILGLQTLKEFVKSSYESGLAKYWEIENQIMELQEKVGKLQDEYEVEVVIEDNEARTVMAEAALKSCQETLAVLQEKQEKSNREAKVEFKRIEAAREILKTFKREYMKEELDDQKANEDEEAVGGVGNVSGLIEELKDIDPLQKKAETEKSKSSSATSLTVTELAEKIDALVNKVISLETAVSSQTVLINSLRTESNELHAQIKSLEDEKESLLGNTHNLRTRVKEMEDKLRRLQALNKNVESQNTNLETNFAEARCSLDHLSEKLGSVRPDEEVEVEIKEDKDVSGDDEGKSKKKKKKKDKESKSKKKKDKNKKDVPSSDEKLQEIAEQIVVPMQVEEKKDIVPMPEEEKKDIVPMPEEDKKDIVPTPDDSKLQEIKEPKNDSMPLPDEDKRSTTSSKVEEKEEVKEVDISVEHSEPSAAKQDIEVDKTVERSATFSDKKETEDVPVNKNDEALKAQSEGEKEKESELSWQQMLLSGTEDREKILLKEYTTILRNYKDVKRKLSDTEKKDRDIQFDITLQMRELKQAILKRDQEIQHLRQQLSLLHGNKDATAEGEQIVKPIEEPEVDEEDLKASLAEKDDDFKLIFEDKSPPVSVVEEKLRTELDAILDENLDFWLRFSTSFHQVQKFKSEVQDLKDEISKLKDKKKQEGSMTSQIKSEVRPIYKHLREIQTELTVWLEQSVCLKEELKRRFSSLCSIQEEITTALKEGVEEEEIRFSSHQAAKLQGEILNMKQENNKVREELQACLDHVSVLQLDIEKTLRQLNAEFGISNDQPNLQHSISRSRVPLRSFIFGTKEKKHKSIFSFMQPNRKYHVVRALPPTR